MNFKRTNRNLLKSLFLALAFCGLLAANPASAFAQFTFMGDYDKSFAAPNGYYVDPQTSDPTLPSTTTVFFTGDLNPDGSIIAGGRILRGDAGDFWLRKFTASGAVDSSFGGGAGFVRTTFFTNTSGYNNVLPQVLKRQPDGKILFAGKCDGQTSYPNTNSSFGSDVCVVRYNADGTLDASFGNNSVLVGDSAHPCPEQTNSCSYTFQPGPGKFTIQSGQITSSNFRYGTNGTIYDIALQADGKIILAGETRDELPGDTRYVGILIRLNPNGSLDTSFGSGGIARLAGARTSNPSYTTTAPVRFRKVIVQPDGRIVAAGYDGTVEDYFTGTVFLVTRWTANGQLETKRRLDNNASQAARESATGLLLSRDGTKLFVSGSYQSAETLVRLNLNDLSVDSTFGTNGVQRYFYYSDGNGQNRTLTIKAIQPDGKILATDDAFVNDSHVIRFNPNGSPDQSFGNVGFDSTNQQPVTPRGRLALPVQTNIATRLSVAHILLRPDGKLNLIGSAGVDYGFDVTRGAVSQQINVIENGIYSDFTNDGKSEIAVYRPSEGVWFRLDSANFQFGATQFGVSTDKLAPADYDGDGKTDLAIYRDGLWVILQSSNNQVRYVNFGVGEDLPRPGDFDGDGYADISVWRPSNGYWYRLNSSDNSFAAVQWGQSGDSPMLGDYDRDGKTDFVVFRPASGVWFISRSSDFQIQAAQFGLSNDIPLNGDFDGDGQSDLAVYRPSNGFWYTARTITGTPAPAQNFNAVQFGVSTDVPVPADYDGDGKTDLAVYRDGLWVIMQTSSNQVRYVNFGLPSDKPVPAAYRLP